MPERVIESLGVMGWGVGGVGLANSSDVAVGAVAAIVVVAPPPHPLNKKRFFC